MTISDWEDWLPGAVAEDDPDGVAIWYLGCNGFIITDGETTLFIDPYVGTGSPPRTIRMIPVPFDPVDIEEADAILVTHEHTDHLDEASQAPILERTGATLYAPGVAIGMATDDGWTDAWEIAEHQLAAIAEGETFDVGGFSVTVGPANDPDADEPVSYVIEHAAGTVFHAGDSKPTEAFEAVGSEHDIDLAIVAYGTVGNVRQDDGTRERRKWYADENEVIAMAGALRADRLLPSHWDMWKGLRGDPTVLYAHRSGWEYPHALEIVEIGDRIEL